MAAGAGMKDGKVGDRGPRARGTLFFGIMLTLVFLAVAARLVQLQFMEHETMIRDANRQLFGTVRDRDKRGDIVDARGVTLAASVAVKACAVDPRVFLEKEGANPDKLVATLTELLSLTGDQAVKLNEGLAKTRENKETGEKEPIRFVWVKRMLTEEEWGKISSAMLAAKKEAGEAWRNRRRWLKVADKMKVAGEKEKLAFANEAAKGWRDVAVRAEGRFAGVFFPPEFKRVYPQGTLASHVLGFGDIDGRGMEGVEKTCEALLKGTAVDRMVIRDARSRALSVMAPDERSTSGMKVELTVDSVVQAIVEEELKRAIDEYRRKDPKVYAHAIVMDPFTGDILAMANYPTFDPNHPGIDPETNEKVPPEYRDNNAVAALQEPGSTFKPMMVAAALEEKIASLDDPWDCSTFRMENGRTIKDIYPYGRMTLEMGLVKSSNPAMVRLGLKLGPEKMRDYVLKFGFGKRTGSSLPAERHGNVTAKEKWSLYTMGSVPMGYEIDVTTLQMACAYSVFANGGMLPKPNIVRAIYDASGGLALATKPEMRHRVISEETAATMRRVLRKVVTDGTGRRANFPEYELGGKTGTANMIANKEERAAGLKGYSKNRHTANFVAIAPWDKPRAIVCVSVRDTTKFGGEASSPIGMAVSKRVLAYWGVPTANGEPIKADFFPERVFQPIPVPTVYIQGTVDDENYMPDAVDSRWMDDWIEDEEAVG